MSGSIDTLPSARFWVAWRAHLRPDALGDVAGTGFQAQPPDFDLLYVERAVFLKTPPRMELSRWSPRPRQTGASPELASNTVPDGCDLGFGAALARVFGPTQQAWPTTEQSPRQRAEGKWGEECSIVKKDVQPCKCSKTGATASAPAIFAACASLYHSPISCASRCTATTVTRLQFVVDRFEQALFQNPTTPWRKSSPAGAMAEDVLLRFVDMRAIPSIDPVGSSRVLAHGGRAQRLARC